MSDTKVCGRCGGPIWMVEYPLPDKHHYDGVSEYACKDEKCGWRIGRWCGEELETGMVEPVFCQGKSHPRIFAL